MGLLVAMTVWAAWWITIRPQMLYHQAQAILESDPEKAAMLLEDATGTSLWELRDAEVLWARTLLRMGQTDEATGCFSLIESPQLAHSEGLVKLADEASAQKLPLLAIFALEAIAPTDLRRCDAIDRLIPLKLQLGGDLAALSLADEWTQLQPENPRPWLQKARLREKQAALPDALADYREYLSREHDPHRQADGLRSMIRLLIATGERQQARTRWNELAHSTVTLTPLDKLAEAQLRRLEGDIDGAWRQIEEVLKTEATNPVARELRGTLAMDRGDYDFAVSDLKLVIQQQPWSQGAHYKLAQALTKLSRGQEAAAHMNESHRLLKMSLRVLKLRSQDDLTSQETEELASAMQQIGLKSGATRLRQLIAE